MEVVRREGWEWGAVCRWEKQREREGRRRGGGKREGTERGRHDEDKLVSGCVCVLFMLLM